MPCSDGLCPVCLVPDESPKLFLLFWYFRNERQTPCVYLSALYVSVHELHVRFSSKQKCVCVTLAAQGFVVQSKNWIIDFLLGNTKPVSLHQ